MKKILVVFLCALSTLALARGGRGGGGRGGGFHFSGGGSHSSAKSTKRHRSSLRNSYSSDHEYATEDTKPKKVNSYSSLRRKHTVKNQNTEINKSNNSQSYLGDM
jgi:hypothetical protein